LDQPDKSSVAGIIAATLVAIAALVAIVVVVVDLSVDINSGERYVPQNAESSQRAEQSASKQILEELS
jgi:hypothetical protein